jgi:dihydroneopterin aldolase
VLHDIFITDIHLLCRIGVRPDERLRRQPVEVSVRLSAELPEVGRQDEIEATVDYAELHGRIAALVERSAFMLVESLAHRIAGECLEDSRVRSVEVTVIKPEALPSPARAGVTIRRVAEPGGKEGR